MADVVITIETGNASETMRIPDAKVAQFRTEFLAAMPVPQIDDPAWDVSAHASGTPVDQVDKYNILKHFLHVMKDKFIVIRNQGKNAIADAAKTYDDNDVIVD